MDPIADPSKRGLLEIIEFLKSAYRLEVDIDIQITSEPFLLGGTFREKGSYQIFISEPEQYLLLHEFYHVLGLNYPPLK